MDGSRAYVAVGADGLKVFDFSGAGTPPLLAVVDTVGDALGVVVQGGIAHVADSPATISIIRLGP